MVSVNCCVKKKCWCFVTEGMGGANQEEMVSYLCPDIPLTEAGIQKGQ